MTNIKTLSFSHTRYFLTRRFRSHGFSTANVETSNNYDHDNLHETNPNFPHLFQPLDLGSAIGSLPNRVIMGSMHTGLEVS